MIKGISVKIRVYRFEFIQQRASETSGRNNDNEKAMTSKSWVKKHSNVFLESTSEQAELMTNE